ncbi:MAG: phosphatidate cytidylyltransferase [Gammaproteobacteria bacterium]|nr:phosphatidate cytidylyltransferase [Gammaproteobacteria bacterium]
MVSTFLGPDALFLISGILAVLILGSVVGWLLKIVVARRQPHAIIDNVIARVQTWWLIAAAFAVAFLIGRAGVCLLFGFASLVALREFLPPQVARPGETVMRLGAFYLALPAQYLLLWYGDERLLPLLIPAYAFLLVPLMAILAGDARDLPHRSVTLYWGLMLCVLGVSFVPALLGLQIPGYEGRTGFLLAFLVLVSQLSDVFQFVWGTLAGRHALAPTVSPSKTVEGLVGGVLTATLIGVALAPLTPFNPVEAALMALVIALLGTLGGLTLSAIKRDRGIKDWNSYINGHGGMLDRLDSLCLSAPVFYYWVKFGWAS